MEKKRSVHLIFICILILALLPSSSVFGQRDEEVPFAREQALKLIEKLSPAERIGQLFLLTFNGIEITPESEIYQLIRDFHISGVVIQQENGNIPAENSEQPLDQLIDEIQTIALEDQREGENQAFRDEGQSIPLFIGVSQVGGGYPYDQVLTGISLLPSPMSVGATWDPELALSIGEAYGSELESAGINLLLGPSMDVLDMSYSQFDSSIGVRTFGGDPYWVGELGMQFITGLHRGSNGRLAVIARNFPGRGSTDRLPDEEVSTVRKSLEQLKLIELAPFFRITDVDTVMPASVTDGLITSHIRYQGFQGNIRATTKPVSFDQNAIDLLMGLTPLNSWREDGGLLISDDLGSNAIAKFFDPNNQFIDARQVAKNAFLAGNDILYIDQLVSTGDADRFQTYKEIISFFQEKYIEDSAFAQRVDESVIRILSVKYELYDDFTIDRIVGSDNSYSLSMPLSDLQFAVAQQGATLINPTQTQLTELITEPPQISDRIIIFTQDQTIIPCENCDAVEVFPVNGLQKAILALYGPEASGQFNQNRIVSYSFRDLSDFLAAPINRPEIEENLSSANWVVFAVRESTPGEIGDDVLEQLIANNSTLLLNKNVVVFSFDAPFYFDATEISALTAYYGLYSKLPAFIEVAARILFQEIIPISASPVSIPGVGYDLIEQVTPNPEQIINLAVDVETAKLLQTEPQTENSPLIETPIFKLGDTLPVIAGVIVDHNGNTVPDGTIVSFTMAEQGNLDTVQQVETQTVGGMATASFPLLKPGIHEIRVYANPALNSEILILDISEEETTVSEIVPTIPPPVEEIEENPASVESEVNIEPVEPNPKGIEWLLATFLSWIFGILIFLIIRDYFILYENYIISGFGIIGGLLNTAWMILGLPGSTLRFGTNGYVRLGMVVLLGVVMGAYAGWILLRLRIIHLGQENS